MKKFLTMAIVLLFLASGTGWARKKKSDETDTSGKSSKHHSHKKGSKGSKGSKSKSEEGFNSESEINQKDVTFNFEDNKKGNKKGKSKKKKSEDSLDIPLEDSKQSP
jgi:hypothetical protein